MNHTLAGSTCARTSDTYAALTTTSAADRTVNYVYGPEHQRVRQGLVLSGTGTSAYFAGNTWYLNGEDSLGLTAFGRGGVRMTRYWPRSRTCSRAGGS